MMLVVDQYTEEFEKETQGANFDERMQKIKIFLDQKKIIEIPITGKTMFGFRIIQNLIRKGFEPIGLFYEF